MPCPLIGRGHDRCRQGAGPTGPPHFLKRRIHSTQGRHSNPTQTQRPVVGQKVLQPTYCMNQAEGGGGEILNGGLIMGWSDFLGFSLKKFGQKSLEGLKFD